MEPPDDFMGPLLDITRESKLRKHQTLRFGAIQHGTGRKLYLNMRFDDWAQTGFNTFRAWEERRGVVYRHDGRKEYAVDEFDGMGSAFKFWPELAHMAQYQYCSTRGPSGYFARTMQYACSCDNFGRQKGELIRDEFGHPFWVPVFEEIPRLISATTPPSMTVRYKPLTGDGRKPDIYSARQSACWPEAMLADFNGPPERVYQVLAARLPKVLEDFRLEIERLGFEW